MIQMLDLLEQSLDWFFHARSMEHVSFDVQLRLTTEEWLAARQYLIRLPIIRSQNSITTFRSKLSKKVPVSLAAYEFIRDIYVKVEKKPFQEQIIKIFPLTS